MERILTNGLYQSISNVDVEYHAGTFFVSKLTRYLKFSTDGFVRFLQRIEGQHVHDSDFHKLFFEFDKSDLCQIISVEKVNWNDLILLFHLTLENKKVDALCFPSKFIETVQGPITELVLDWRNLDSKQLEVYRFIEIQ